MDVQKACLSKIVLDGELQPFIDANITVHFFTEDNHRKVFDFVMDHYKTMLKPPSADAVHKAYPNYVFEDFPEPVEYYLHQLQEDRKYHLLLDVAQQIVDRIQDHERGPNPGTDLEHIMQRGLATALHEIPQGKLFAPYREVETRLVELRERLANPDSLRGISTGIQGIDYVTRGLQKQQLVTLIGTPKVGKSSVLLWMAYSASIQNYKALYFTFEMSIGEQEDRLTSIMSGVDIGKILRGEFSKEFSAIEKAMRAHEALDDGLIFANSTYSTLSGVQSYIHEQQPDVVFIDGVYLMDDESNPPFVKGTPQALTALTRGFKQMAQRMDLPIVLSTQALHARSRNGLKIDSPGYSSSFAQDSDVLLGVEQLEKPPNTSKVSVIAQRSGPRRETYLTIDWSQGSISELSKKEVEALAGGSTRVGLALRTQPGQLDVDDDDPVILAPQQGDPKRQKRKGA